MRKTITFKKNEIILQDGEIGEGFYILEAGELAVVRDGLVLNEISQKGAIFGELSGLLKYKRKASIRAKTDVTAIHIEKVDITDIKTKPSSRVFIATTV